MIDVDGIITTVAGTGIAGFGGDGGPASEAGLRLPRGVAVDANGNLYVADFGNQRVRKVDAAGTITTVAGNGYWQHGGDRGLASEAALHGPTAVASDTTGNIFVATRHRVRKIDVAGIITTFAGTGDGGYAGDGGPASDALINYPTGLAVDADGSVYVAELRGRRIRRIDRAGIITTFAGTGRSGYSEDGGKATDTPLASPSGLALDTLGNVFVSDRFANRIRKIDVTGIVSTVAGTGNWKDQYDTAGSDSVRFPVTSRRGT